MRAGPNCEFAVDLELVIFAGDFGAFEQEKFGAEESYPFGPVFIDQFEFVREFDVCREGDMPSVEGGAFLISEGLEGLACDLVSGRKCLVVSRCLR